MTMQIQQAFVHVVGSRWMGASGLFPFLFFFFLPGFGFLCLWVISRKDGGEG